MVFGPNAAASSARGSSQSGGSSRTKRGTAPSRRTTGSVGVVERLDQHAPRRPGSSTAIRQAVIASVAPEVTTTSLAQIDLEPIEAAVGGGHRLAQFRHAGHRRILVAAVLQRVGRRLHHVRRPVGIGKALAEIDRLVLDRERRHHREDRGADAGQQGIGGLHVASALRPRAGSRGAVCEFGRCGRFNKPGNARAPRCPRSRRSGDACNLRIQAGEASTFGAGRAAHSAALPAWHAACKPVALPFRPRIDPGSQTGGGPARPGI